MKRETNGTSDVSRRSILKRAGVTTVGLAGITGTVSADCTFSPNFITGGSHGNYSWDSDESLRVNIHYDTNWGDDTPTSRLEHEIAISEFLKDLVDRAWFLDGVYEAWYEFDEDYSCYGDDASEATWQMINSSDYYGGMQGVHCFLQSYDQSSAASGWRENPSVYTPDGWDYSTPRCYVTDHSAVTSDGGTPAAASPHEIGHMLLSPEYHECSDDHHLGGYVQFNGEACVSCMARNDYNAQTCTDGGDEGDGDGRWVWKMTNDEIDGVTGTWWNATH